MRIVVLDGYTSNPGGDNPWDDVAALGDLTVYDRTAPELTVERARDAEVVLTNKTVLSAEILEQLPKLRFISVLATGFNVVDVEAARKRGITVSNVPIYATDSVAQFVFALLLELCHHIALHSESVHSGEWERSPDFCYWKQPLIELAGKRMGIIGFGRIGRRVGEIAHVMGMEVLAYDLVRDNPPAYQPFEWRELDEVFSQADVVSLHTPLTPENEGLVNRARLASMKPEAFLINTGRGPLVVEQDLADALKAGVIAGAGVDVVSTEPIQPDNPLLTAPNCLITPHIAWATSAARRRLMKTTADNIAAYQAGSPINMVN